MDSPSTAHGNVMTSMPCARDGTREPSSDLEQYALFRSNIFGNFDGHHFYI